MILERMRDREGISEKKKEESATRSRESDAGSALAHSVRSSRYPTCLIAHCKEGKSENGEGGGMKR